MLLLFGLILVMTLASVLLVIQDLCLSCICLEHVSVFVFKLDLSISLVLNEHSIKFGSIILENSPSTNSLVALPFAIIIVTVLVVMYSLAVSTVVLEVSFVIFTIAEQNLDLRVVSNLPDCALLSI